MRAINWIQLFLLVGLILLGIFVARFESLKLQKCSQECKAVIIDKNKRKNRGYFIKYKYFIEDKVYTSSESIKKKNEINSFNIGDTIDIIISCIDFNVSRYKKLNNDN